MQQLRAFLSMLEVPRCECPAEWLCRKRGRGMATLASLPRCQHVRAARYHGLSLAEWAELLWDAWPADYQDPPTPDAPTWVLSQPARVEVYRQRHAAGQHISHPLDVNPFPVLGEQIALQLASRERKAARGTEADWETEAGEEGWRRTKPKRTGARTRAAEVLEELAS